MVEQVLGKVPAILAVGVLARTAQKVTSPGRAVREQKTTLKASSLAVRRVRVLGKSKKQREEFLNVWYDLDRKSFNRLFKLDKGKGQAMVFDLMQDNPQLFNHIWDVKGQRN